MAPKMQANPKVKSAPTPITATSASKSHLRGPVDIGLKGAHEGKGRPLRPLAVFAALLIIVVFLQWLGAAYSCEFRGPDEAANIVTGLMIRDYLASGFQGNPLMYAEKYYVHYPKVAFSLWGPLLHFTEAAWTLILPPTRTTLLLLMALITAGTALMIYQALVGEFGAVLGLASACLFIAIPSVQRYTGMIMGDSLVALLDLAATMAFGRYLNTQKQRDALLFAACASLSILTKGNGVALVLLPGFVILFTRSFGILKQRLFWIAAATIAVIAGPWQYYSARVLWGIEDRHPGWMFFVGHGRNILSLVGLALFPVVAIGIYDRLIAPARKGTADGKWVAAGALICSVWVFHSLMPAAGAEVRYMIATAPPLLLFFIAGTNRIARWISFPGLSIRSRAWGIAAILIGIFLSTVFTIPRKSHYGFDQVAALVHKPEYKGHVVLVSSGMLGAEGEGMLISEIAMREKRPSSFVLRATKMLSQSDWLGGRYALLYQTPEEVIQFLRSVPVGIVVIQNERGVSATRDHQLLQESIAAYPAEWVRLETYAENESTIDVYFSKSAAVTTHKKIHIDLPYTLRRSIEE